MSEFDDTLDEYLGTGTDRGDIRAIVRRCWHYAIDGLDIRMWQGQGKLHTTDGNTWLGTIGADGKDYHQTPRLADGRDGTSLEYRFSLGYLDEATYNSVKDDQSLVVGRPLTCYLALFQPNEGLRPQTPIDFFKQVTMYSMEFDESLVLEGMSFVRRFKATVLAKDGNAGRSEVPARTYTDTIQKEYARQLGVELDRGCEFIAGMANRDYKQPD
jgi:hypothetical protein